jgi:hypothetical protein
MMEPPLRVFTSLCHQKMEVGVEIYLLSEGLDGGHNTRKKLCAGGCLEVFEEGMDSCLAKIPQKPALVAEEDAQHLIIPNSDIQVRIGHYYVELRSEIPKSQ